MTAWPNLQSPWTIAQQAPQKPAFDDSDDSKRRFGIELAKGLTPFQAASQLFPFGQGVKLWVAERWPTDLLVLSAKDEHLKELEYQNSNLDKDGLAAKVLAFANETYEFNGVKRYTNEGKDRLAAYKLYGEIKGYVGKAAEINNNFAPVVDNKIEIVFVKPNDNMKTIDAVSNSPKSEILNSEKPPFEIKLVSNSR